MYRTSTNMLILTFAVICLTATFVLAQTGGAGGAPAHMTVDTCGKKFFPTPWVST